MTTCCFCLKLRGVSLYVTGVLVVLVSLGIVGLKICLGISSVDFFPSNIVYLLIMGVISLLWLVAGILTLCFVVSGRYPEFDNINPKAVKDSSK